MGDRCTGHCCRRFFLGYSPEELTADLERWRRDGESRFSPPGEIEKVATMVVLLERDVVRGRDENLIAYDPPKPKSENPGYWYTCRHLNVMTGDCTNYEGRPEMCSKYPYGGTCSYRECTWDEGRAQPPIPSTMLVRKVEKMREEIHELQAKEAAP